MSKTSSKSATSSKRVAFAATCVVSAGLVLALPQTQDALPIAARPMQAASLLLHSATNQPATYWHTEGSRIVDSSGHVVRISGVNWSGLETKDAVPGGLDQQDYRAILHGIKNNGFNTIRIPFSNEMVEFASVPERVRFENPNGPINTDLRGLTSLEILDKIVIESGKLGLKVILDNHRSEGGSSAEENGLWYTARFPESAWIEDWRSLARRYANDSTVIGMDLRNEPHNANRGGSCWDCGGPNDWHLASSRAGNAVLAVNPRLLIFVEGVDSYENDGTWWGGNLEGVRRSPVHLSLPGRLVYSAHEYGPVEYSQPWFNRETSPVTLAALWHKRWAYISESGIAPVWVGEFGTPNTDLDVRSSLPGSEGQWFSTLIAYLQTHSDLGWTYWGVNGEDRYGLLDSNYTSVSANRMKFDALVSINRANRALGSPEALPANGIADAARLGTSISIPSTGATFATQTESNPPQWTSTSTSPINTIQVATAHRASTLSQRARDAEIESAIAASVQHAVRKADTTLGDDGVLGDREAGGELH